MSLNETVSAERIHISLFGLRNAGKSSLVNALRAEFAAVVEPGGVGQKHRPERQQFHRLFDGVGRGALDG